MSTAFQKAVRKQGRKIPEVAPQFREGRICSPSYNLVSECDRFPLSSEEEVQQWASFWFDWKAQRNRMELRCGKNLRKLWKNGKHFREVIEKALKGEPFTEQELRASGAVFLSLITHHHWQDLEAIAAATKSTVESIRFDLRGSGKKDIVTLNAFMDLSERGRLPTKAEIKKEVGKSIKGVSDSNFTKIFEKVGLDGLRDGKRGPDAAPRKKRTRKKA